MMIQVASQIAPLIGACKRRQLLSRNVVPSQIFSIGESFLIGEELWSGTAIVSPDALFLLKVLRQNDPVSLPGQSSPRNLALCPKPLLTVPYSQLPCVVTDDKNWPAPPTTDCDVAILLREDAKQVRAIPFTTDVEFESESPRVLVTCSSVGPLVAAGRLQRAGWIKGVSSANSMPNVTLHHRTPYVIAAGLLVLALITTMVIRIESISTQLAMLLGIPLLAAAAYASLRYSGKWPVSQPHHWSDER